MTEEQNHPLNEDNREPGWERQGPQHRAQSREDLPRCRGRGVAVPSWAVAHFSRLSFLFSNCAVMQLLPE